MLCFKIEHAQTLAENAATRAECNHHGEQKYPSTVCVQKHSGNATSKVPQSARPWAKDTRPCLAGRGSAANLGTHRQTQGCLQHRGIDYKTTPSKRTLHKCHKISCTSTPVQNEGYITFGNFPRVVTSRTPTAEESHVRLGIFHLAWHCRPYLVAQKKRKARRI